MTRRIATVMLVLLGAGAGWTADDAAGEPHVNRLATAKSPYLQQHANNPVDWYPWGEEAFAAAADQDKPIFLSIGYATCHWCHVMEHESFEDPEVAQLMNETFINIKVDREERPDVDQVYMTVCQMLTGSGGWPLTIIMTPDKQPFFAATYIPKTSRMGRPGMLDLIPRVQSAWVDRRSELLKSATEIIGHLEATARGGAPGELDARILAAAEADFAGRFDATWGGFDSAPKFPSPHNLLFLLARAESTDNQALLDMATTTLAFMRKGGLFDHIGFGFHRYSTDRRWLVPHFEKMLYDQAMLMLAYTEGHRLTGSPWMAATVDQVATYVLRDMTAPEGGFYSAEDADSEGEEGLFYLWTEEELATILGQEEAAFAEGIWSTRPEGNFEPEAGERTTDNILHLAPTQDLDALVSGDEAERLAAIRSRLFDAREERIHPLKDDKVLADWNGLMAAALARAGRILDRPAYVQAAADAMEFTLGSMRAKDGRLLHRWHSQDAAIPGFLDDHAFAAWACLELYDSTLTPVWLERAAALVTEADRLFADAESGGYFFTGSDNEELLVRQKEVYDGAIPSGNSVMVHVLVRLSRLTGVTAHEAAAESILNAFGGTVARLPAGHAHFLHGLHRMTQPSLEVVVAGDPGREDTKRMLSTVRDSAPIDAAILLLPPDDAGAGIRSAAPFTEAFTTIDGRATAYVCRGFACQLPTTDPAEARRQILGGTESENEPATGR
jgi:uncharacterized protein YyaL (SSP411 family)